MALGKSLSIASTLTRLWNKFGAASGERDSISEVMLSNNELNIHKMSVTR
jgi:hypothetical protein